MSSNQLAIKNLSIKSSQTAIGFGVVGCGWVARDYVIPAILAAGNAGLVALCDADGRSYDLVLPGDQSIVRTDNLSEFLAAPGLEAVYIATPNSSHRFLTEHAANAGKHVLCEKPMATNLADAAAMIEICERRRVLYATAFDQRFQARHLKLKELISAGELGQITAARIHYACWLPDNWAANNWRIDRETAGGGAFIDLAPHGIDLLQFLLGEELIDFSAFLQHRVHDYAVDDGAVAIGRFAGGALMTMNVAYNCPDNFPRRTLEIIGTQANVVAINTMGQTAGGSLFLTGSDGETREISLSAAEDVSPFHRQIETFSDCLLKGRPFPFSPEGDLATMRILLSAV